MADLNKAQAWDLVLASARAFRAQGTTLESPTGQRYSLGEITDKSIEVVRLDSPKPVKMGKRLVTKAIERFVEAGCDMGKQELIYTVAQEIALVALHPQLAWQGKRIILKGGN